MLIQYKDTKSKGKFLFNYRFIHSSIFVIILSLYSSCTYIQVPFPNEIQGNKAREMIMDTIINTEILIYTQYPNLKQADSSYYNVMLSKMMFSQQIIYNHVSVPALIRIDEKKMYKRDTVEKCIDIIRIQSFLYASQGIPYPDILATSSCHVEEASILQLGKTNFL
jgi:small lipoprotein (TIGR04452 family)